MPKRRQKHKQNKGLKVGRQLLLGLICVVLLSVFAWQNETIKSRMINIFGDNAKYQKEAYEKQKALAAKKYGPTKQSSQTSKKEATTSQKESSVSSLKKSKKATKYVTYTVRSGDSLTEIATRYGTSVQELIKINDLPATGRVVAGEILKIPDNGKVSAETKADDPNTSVSTASQTNSSVSTDSSYDAQNETESEEETTATSQTDQTVGTQAGSRSDADE